MSNSIILLTILIGLAFIILTMYLIFDVFEIAKTKKLKLLLTIICTFIFIILLCLPPLGYYVLETGTFMFYLDIILLLVKFVVKPVIRKKYKQPKNTQNFSASATYEDKEFVAFYEGYKDLDDADKEILKATLDAFVRAKKGDK